MRNAYRDAVESYDAWVATIGPARAAEAASKCTLDTPEEQAQHRAYRRSLAARKTVGIDVDRCREVVAAMDDERRQTQRRMIAALYWRAGECYRQARSTPLGCTYRTSTLREACALEAAASAMEAAL